MSVAAKKRCKYPATQELFTYLTGRCEGLRRFLRAGPGHR